MRLQIMRLVTCILDFGQKMQVEASDSGNSKEKQEKKVIQISYTQPKGIQKAIKETRAKNKEISIKDAIATEILINLIFNL